MAYAIGPWPFVRWIGQPPPLVKQHVATFNKIGQAGISAQLTGIHGDPFETEVWSTFANQLLATVADESYRDLIGVDPVDVVFAGTSYAFAFNHTYLITKVDTIEMKAHPWLLGLDYSYQGGWLVKTRWTLIPITT